MHTEDFAHAPLDAVAYHRATQRLLHADAETAVCQSIGAKKDKELGTRTPLTAAVHCLVVGAAHNPRGAGKPLFPGGLAAWQAFRWA